MFFQYQLLPNCQFSNFPWPNIERNGDVGMHWGLKASPHPERIDV